MRSRGHRKIIRARGHKKGYGACTRPLPFLLVNAFTPKEWGVFCGALFRPPDRSPVKTHRPSATNSSCVFRHFTTIGEQGGGEDRAKWLQQLNSPIFQARNDTPLPCPICEIIEHVATSKQSHQTSYRPEPPLPRSRYLRSSAGDFSIIVTGLSEV